MDDRAVSSTHRPVEECRPERTFLGGCLGERIDRRARRSVAEDRAAVMHVPNSRIPMLYCLLACIVTAQFATAASSSSGIENPGPKMGFGIGILILGY